MGPGEALRISTLREGVLAYSKAQQRLLLCGAKQTVPGEGAVKPVGLYCGVGSGRADIDRGGGTVTLT